MNRDKIKKHIYTIIFMMAITIVFISGVSFAYLVTRDTVIENQKLYLIKGVLSAAGLAVPDRDYEVKKLYREKVEEVKNEEGKTRYYVIKNSETREVEACVFVEEGQGLWGPITAAVGFETDGKTVKGFSVLEQSETPGLGGRITEEWFQNQFEGKKPPFGMVPEGEDAGVNEFDAITGATKTSMGVRNLLNNAAERAEKIKND